jgi:hypothetical protein
MKLNTHFFLKLLLLMMLSLKGSFAVYQNISELTSTEKISFFLDIDESEKEDKKELEESEKIQQKLNTAITFSALKKSKHNSNIVLNYKVLHLEYTAQPPETG